MPDIGKTKATLRIIGDDLDPDEISKLLGCAPSESARKGVLRQTPSGHSTLARFGAWNLKAEACSPGDLNAQIKGLFVKLTNDLTVWNEISGRFKCDVFCGLFMTEGNEGASLQPDVLSIMGERGVQLALDIYHFPQLKLLTK